MFGHIVVLVEGVIPAFVICSFKKRSLRAISPHLLICESKPMHNLTENMQIESVLYWCKGYLSCDASGTQATYKN